MERFGIFVCGGCMHEYEHWHIVDFPTCIIRKTYFFGYPYVDGVGAENCSMVLRQRAKIYVELYCEDEIVKLLLLGYKRHNRIYSLEPSTFVGYYIGLRAKRMPDIRILFDIIDDSIIYDDGCQRTPKFKAVLHNMPDICRQYLWVVEENAAMRKANQKQRKKTKYWRRMAKEAYAPSGVGAAAAKEHFDGIIPNLRV